MSTRNVGSNLYHFIVPMLRMTIENLVAKGGRLRILEHEINSLSRALNSHLTVYLTNLHTLTHLTCLFSSNLAFGFSYNFPFLPSERGRQTQRRWSQGQSLNRNRSSSRDRALNGRTIPKEGEQLLERLSVSIVQFVIDLCYLPLLGDT